MRALLLLPLCFFTISCAGTPKVANLQLNARPTKVPAEVFVCDDEPKPWSPSASDPDIAQIESETHHAVRDCHRQLHTICKILEANELLIGVCPEEKKTAS